MVCAGTRVQRALSALNASSADAEPDDETPVTLQIYIDLPLPLES